MQKCEIKLVQFFLYCCSLIYKKNHVHAICIYLHLLLIKSKLKDIFTIQTVPYELFIKLVQNGPNDLNNSILINDKYHKHILNNTNLINLHDFDSKTNFRTVQIIPTNKLNLQNNKIIVSYHLYHNLQKNNIKNKVQLNFTAVKTQQIAKEVELSLISSPFDFNNALVDDIIKNYLKSPKILYKDDTICVNLKQYVPHLIVTNLKLNQYSNYAYFKCKNISDCKYGYFAVIGETAVKQSVTIQGRTICRPKVVKNRKEMVDLDDLLMNPYPDGLDKYFIALEEAVKPFFERDLKIHPLFLIEGCKGCGKCILVEALANTLGIHLFNVPCADLVGNNYMQMEIRLKNCFFRAQICSPCILHLQNFEQFGKNNEGEHDPRIINYFSDQLIDLFRNSSATNRIVVICSSNSKSLHADFARMFIDTITIRAADLNERHAILRWLTDKDDIDVSSDTLRAIAQKMNGFYYEDFKTLLYNAMNIRLKKNRFEFEAKMEKEFLDDGLELMQSVYNESIGAPKVPKVQWSDIGGLNDVKDEIIKTINLPLKHPDFLKTTGLKRSGILLYGPPGTGKTLMAKAVATECSLCFLSVKGPELLNMYIGQSEQNVREVFEKAREASPCIIFFDELDALAPNRGISGDSGGVMDRIVSQLLSEMDGINDSGLVFIIGATNRPDLIDPALLRPGRFDKLLYVGPCEDFHSKLSVLKALTRKFKLAPDLDLSAVISASGANFTGADMYGICSGAWLNAAKRIISNFEKENSVLSDNTEVVVNFDDFQLSILNAKPSVNDKDMEYFNKLKNELNNFCP